MTNKYNVHLLERAWYIPSNYKENSHAKSWEHIFQVVATSPSAWIQADWEKAKIGPHIFLSRSPLTFGHSIIVIPKPMCNESVDEVTFFRLASCLIEMSIQFFNEAFKNKSIHQVEKYSELGKDTNSSGEYIKTLIIKANADEDIYGEYKGAHFSLGVR
jgi:hypothetical protein